MTSPHSSRLERACHGLARIEDGALALLLTAVIVLATTQIVLRNALDTAWPWIGPLLRYLVVWLGLMGALSAARTHEHIAIDALARVLPSSGRRIAASITGALSTSVCALIAYHGARLVTLDRDAGSLAFGSVPTWPFVLVIPLCFAGMGLRYALRSIHDLRAPTTRHSDA